MPSIDYQPARLRIQNPVEDRVNDWLNIPLATAVGLTLIAFVSFLNLVSLTDKDKVGLDLPVLLKLMGIAGAGVYGAIGAVTDRRVRDMLQTFPVFWVAIIIVMYFVAVPTSLTPLFSMISSISILAILLMTVRALIQIGVMPVLNAIFVGMAFFNVLSWAAFFFWPEVGVFLEPIPDGKFAHRMGGLAHPNVLGQYAGLTVVLGTIMYFTYKKRSTLRLSMILVALGALVSSLSRTSLVATVVALLIAYRRVFFKSRYLARYAVVAFAGVLGVMILSTQMDIGHKIQEKLTLVSKSGDASELTTATGRAEIWAYTFRLIAEHPLIGYGAATSKFYLAQYSSYTHNMVLKRCLFDWYYRRICSADDGAGPYSSDVHHFSPIGRWNFGLYYHQRSV